MAQGPCWCDGLEMLSASVRRTEELNLKITVLPFLVVSCRRILAPHRGGWEYLSYFPEKLNLWHPPSGLERCRDLQALGVHHKQLRKGFRGTGASKLEVFE